MSRYHLGSLALLLSVVSLAAVTGCAPSDPNVPVTGTVSVDGTPIPQGSITFLAEDGAGPSGGGTIKEGKFTASVPPGKKVVLVSGTKVVGQQLRLEGVKDSGMVDKLEAVTHIDYNNAKTSPLRADIQGKTENLEFKLTADGKGK